MFADDATDREDFWAKLEVLILSEETSDRSRKDFARSADIRVGPLALAFGKSLVAC